MTSIKCLVLIALFGMVSSVLTAQKSLKVQALEYYSNSKYPEALVTMKQYLLTEPNDKQAWLVIGACSYLTNDLPLAKQYLTAVIEEKGTKPADAYFFLGRTFQANGETEKAIDYFKEFLRNIPSNDVNRPMVRAIIRRCGNHVLWQGNQSSAFVDPIGDQVNSQGDDFKPILSPNFSDKIYFSSIRDGNLGGLRSEAGLIDEVYGKYSSDIYTAGLRQGEWQDVKPLSYLINTPRHDVAQGFSSDGSMLFYFKGFNLYGGDIFVDTFKVNIEDRSLQSKKFQSAYFPEKGDQDLYLFQDTMMLFSSRRAGGMGGMDVYYSVYRDGQWTEAINLGAPINTPFDELSPFLAIDGRTLYFSTNHNEKSMGGLDILVSQYDDYAEKWKEPSNLLLPINSTGDDNHFVLSEDGLKGYFDSTRKEGKGMRDVWVAYFKQPMESMEAYSIPSLFYEVAAYKKVTKLSGEFSEAGSTNTSSTTTKKAYTLETVRIDDLGEVVLPYNFKKFDQWVAILRESPTASIVLTAHGDKSDPEDFDLFFSLKRAEKAADYLIGKGIKAERIFIQGAGSGYPVSKNEINGTTNATGKQLNRRIEARFVNAEQEGLVINQQDPEVPITLQTKEHLYWKKQVEGLTYRVQIAALGQMYKGDVTKRYPDALAERQMNSNQYQYLVGMFRSFDAAQQVVTSLKNEGITDAFVVPYIGGSRRTEFILSQFLLEYPDLNQYFLSKKKD